MRFLVIGLGSMGKRRIRVLQTLGYKNVYGFDLRGDRRTEAAEKYGVKCYADFQSALKQTNPDALIISVPPDLHHLYVKLAIQNKIHFFVEASVVDTDMDLIKARLQPVDIVAAPSATLIFHPAIKMMANIIKSNALGKISNIILHSGQYLPDWHTYEKVSDYYVSNPVTGGAREIVAFELSWVTHLFGFPRRVCGQVKKTINIKGAEKIDDTYNFLMDYDNFLATITVDVVSRYALRRLLINGDQKQLFWDWNEKCIKIFHPEESRWQELPYKMGKAAVGYNPNIGEDMYVEEIQNFIEAIEGKHPFMNTMENDHNVLKLLYSIELSNNKSVQVEV